MSHISKDPHPINGYPSQPENRDGTLPQPATESAPKPVAAWLKVRDWMVSYRLPILVVAHLVLFAGLYWLAFMMRFSHDIQTGAGDRFLGVPLRYVNVFVRGLPWLLLVKIGVFYCLRSFHGWWRHVNFSDFISLVKSAFAATIVILAIDYLLIQNWSYRVPRMVIFNDFFLTIVVIGGLRSCWRIWDERIVTLDPNQRFERALMLGNNFAEARMAHLMNGQHQLRTRVVGLVSSGDYIKGRRYSDLRIVGELAEIESLMRDHRANTLFVTTGILSGRQLRELLETASTCGFRIKILPPLEDQLRGLDQVPIRDVAYDDLLRREPANLDLEGIGKVIDDKTVLVTGAGGSIGSELCRQLAKFNPRQLVLLGRGENRIYQIQRELMVQFPQIELVPRIANITDHGRIDEIFEQLQPAVVFHAAAHKHVPLVEQNVGESIINNVLGTQVIADAADRHGVSRFVMVSTDKSVNPTSMMGCTKQMAERYCQALDSESKTMFISTRFGNVLGSAGSVVPLFQDQIRRGGPITLTDKRMTRYFMTIPEASQLVMQASSMGKGGEIFVLEMGEPVKIMDLAKDLIRLAGHEPDSIEIVETGIRPGEKLFEELYYENEQSLPTSHEKIMSSYSRMFPLTEVQEQIHRLVDAAYKSTELTRLVMKEVVPEFICETEQSTSKLGSTKQ